MSIYVKMVSELAKERGVPAGEFVKQLNDLGFEVKSHLKKLTQEDLDAIAKLLNPGQESVSDTVNREANFVVPECASIVITKVSEREFTVSAVNSSIVNGNLIVKELERLEGFRSKSEALLESDKLSYKFRTDTSF